MVVDILEILLALLISIHFVNCIWMYTSDTVHQSIMNIYLMYVKDKSFSDEDAIQVEDKVFYIYFKNLYLTILYLSVIGYGDVVSMPDLNTYIMDYTKLLFCMLFGFFVFQKVNA